MAVWCITRGVLAFRGRVGVHARKHAGRSLCVTSSPGVSALTAVQARRNSQVAEDRVHGPFVCYHLPHRSLLKILGEDTSPFLQGIITNDMELLQEPGCKAIYSHMLNVQGRTLYDIMLYRFEEVDAGCGVLLECDSTTINSVMRHLKMYKLRRKIVVNPCPDVSVWAVLPQQKQQCQQLSKPDLSLPEKSLVWETDPRTPEMGWRLVLDSQIEPVSIIASCQKGDTNEYHRHRYTIGLPEGVSDLPPGVALPLESNLVYMQGISFSKGCYIGQELTARTHHTGVVRKRLMPVRLSSPIEHIEEGAALQTQSGKSAGKHRTGIDQLGLSLIRTAHAKEVLILKSSDDTTVTLEVSVPNWWPKDMKN